MSLLFERGMTKNIIIIYDIYKILKKLDLLKRSIILLKNEREKKKSLIKFISLI